MFFTKFFSTEMKTAQIREQQDQVNYIESNLFFCNITTHDVLLVFSKLIFYQGGPQGAQKQNREAVL